MRYLTDEDVYTVLTEVYHQHTDIQHKALREAISRVPTADVQEVVRCKDCKHRKGSACDYSAVWVRENGFCQWGERSEDDME